MKTKDLKDKRKQNRHFEQCFQDYLNDKLSNSNNHLTFWHPKEVKDILKFQKKKLKFIPKSWKSSWDFFLQYFGGN